VSRDDWSGKQRSLGSALSQSRMQFSGSCSHPVRRMVRHQSSQKLASIGY
jgi:hypothetical protein